MESEHPKVRELWAGGRNRRMSFGVHTAPGGRYTVIPWSVSVGKRRKSATLSRFHGRKLEKGWWLAQGGRFEWRTWYSKYPGTTTLAPGLRSSLGPGQCGFLQQKHSASSCKSPTASHPEPTAEEKVSRCRSSSRVLATGVRGPL